MRFPGRKWQKKNKGDGKGNRMSRLGHCALIGPLAEPAGPSGWLFRVLLSSRLMCLAPDAMGSRISIQFRIA
jgi:hypothetical protein